MPEGIKLSNQLYPATEDKILSQAEYIHDSKWEGAKKDQQSINASLKGTIADNINSINEDLTQYINNVTEGGLNAIVPGIGLNLVQRANLSLDSDGRIEINNNEPDEESGEISGISPRILSICPTIYSYQTPNQNYPGVIKGFLRGDVNEDGQVTISDVTELINKILEKDLPEEKLVINMYSINQEDNFNRLLNITNPNTNIKKVKIKITSFGDIIEGNRSQIASDENTDLENHILIQSYPTRETTSENKYFKIKILGYYNDIQDTSDSIITGNIDNNTEYTVYITNVNGEYTFTLQFFVNSEQQDQQDKILMDVDIKIDEGAEYLKFPNQGGSDGSSVNIGDVTALIDYVLKGRNSWQDDYYQYFSEDGFFLYDQNNYKIPVSAGIIYQAVDVSNNTRYYFMAKEEDLVSGVNKLYPFRINSYNVDKMDILKWLKSALIVDDDMSLKITMTKIKFIGNYSQIDDQFVQNLYDYLNNHTEEIDFSYFNTKKIVEIPTTNTIKYLQVFPCFIDKIHYDADLNKPVYDPSFVEDNTIVVSVDENSPVRIVNNIGEQVYSMEFNNISSQMNFILIPIVFNNDDLSKYEYIDQQGGYYQLKEDVELKIELKLGQQIFGNTTENTLTLNCKAINI